MIDLESIVVGCANNDREAQELFFKHFYGRLLTVSRRMGPNDMVADDILQDSFIKIFDKIHVLDNFDELLVFSWCKRIVTNTAIDFFRAEKKRYKEIHSDLFRISDEHFDEKRISLKNSADVPDRWVDDSVDLTSLPEKFCNEHVWTSPYSGIDPAITIQAIQSLSPQYQLVFNLYVLDGYTHEEIANKLNISVGSSKSNLSKARANLMVMLKPKLDYNY
jgi:RNA polymerase sigma factor (sigma-70 family)